MKEIKLSQQGIHNNKYVALVDDDDYDYLMQWKWSFSGPGNGNIPKIYARRSYKDPKTGKYVFVLMHRDIMKTPNGLECDHIDSDTLNNQKSNLRNCTLKENRQNRQTLNRFYGVVKYKEGTYCARISENRKFIYLGFYSSAERAALVRDYHILKRQKYFSKLNFPNRLIINDPLWVYMLENYRLSLMENEINKIRCL